MNKKTIAKIGIIIALAAIGIAMTVPTKQEKPTPEEQAEREEYIQGVRDSIYVDVQDEKEKIPEIDEEEIQTLQSTEPDLAPKNKITPVEDSTPAPVTQTAVPQEGSAQDATTQAPVNQEATTPDPAPAPAPEPAPAPAPENESFNYNENNYQEGAPDPNFVDPYASDGNPLYHTGPLDFGDPSKHISEPLENYVPQRDMSDWELNLGG